MLEPVRQYALERLVATGGYADIRQRHLLFCIAHGEIRDQDTNIGGSRRLAATAEFAQQYPDTRLALTWALESQQTQLGFRLARTVQYFWEARGYWTEGSIWLEKLFLLPDADEPTPAGVVGLLAAGRLTSLQGRFDAAAGYYERSLPLARRAEEPYVRWLGPQNEGLYHADRGDLVHAAELFREARATAAAAGDRIDEGISLATLAFVAWSEADFVNARSLAEESLHVLQQAGEE
jgi:predicted ATPase